MADISVEILEALFQRIDRVKNDPSQYGELYDCYRVWSLMPEAEFVEALVQHGDQLRATLSSVDSATLFQLHAVCSVIRLSPAGPEFIAKLIDFIQHGEVPSVSTLVCGVDLVVIDALADPTDEKFQTVETLLSRLIVETKNVDDIDAKSILFFAKQRLELVKPGTNKKVKGNAAIVPVYAAGKSTPFNEYMTISLIQTGKVQKELLDAN
jgi:hypothetical protein